LWRLQNEAADMQDGEELAQGLDESAASSDGGMKFDILEHHGHETSYSFNL